MILLVRMNQNGIHIDKDMRNTLILIGSSHLNVNKFSDRVRVSSNVNIYLEANHEYEKRDMENLVNNALREMR